MLAALHGAGLCVAVTLRVDWGDGWVMSGLSGLIVGYGGWLLALVS